VGGGGARGEGADEKFYELSEGSEGAAQQPGRVRTNPAVVLQGG